MIFDVRSGTQKPVGTEAGSYSSPRWSPDGERLAYVYGAGEGKGAQVFVYTLSTGTTRAVTNVTQTPHDIAWSPDGHSIAFIMLVPEPPLTLGASLSKPQGANWADPLIVIKDVNYRADGKGYLKRGYSHVFLVSAEGGEARQLTSGSYTEVGPLAWTADGASLLLATNREADWERQPMDPSGTHPRHLNIYRLDLNGNLTELNPQRSGSFHNPTASPDGRWIAYLGFDDRRLGHQNDELNLIARDMRETPSVTRGLDRSVENCVWDSNSRGLHCSYVDRGTAKVAAVTLTGAVKPVVEGLAGSAVWTPYAGGEFSVAKDSVIVYSGARPDRPPELFLARADKTTQLTHLNDPLLSQVGLGALRHLAVRSSFDQRPIDAWEVTPPGFDAQRKYPLILDIHGGPYGAFSPGFSYKYQRFAAAGYLVVYSNPRGSTSYGEEFANLIQHHYPEHDFDDLMSVVDAAISTGNADPDNLFVTGASGGGVLTAWIVGGTHRFRAAASQAPVIDWASWVTTSDVYAYVSGNWFEHLPWDDPETYWRQSPLSRVGNVSTPTLMIAGDQDLRTTLSQAVEFYQGLQLRNVPTELIVVPGASHSISRPSQMAGVANSLLGWFDRYKHSVEPSSQP